LLKNIYFFRKYNFFLKNIKSRYFIRIEWIVWCLRVGRYTFARFQSHFDRCPHTFICSIYIIIYYIIHYIIILYFYTTVQCSFSNRKHFKYYAPRACGLTAILLFCSVVVMCGHLPAVTSLERNVLLLS